MLNSKTALITGATRGIGKAIALAMAKEGADIALIASRDCEQAQNTKKEIEALGVKCTFAACDVSKAQAVDAAVAEILKEFGKIDILVNNAGITADSLLIQMKEESFDRVISVNLKGTYLMTKACIRNFVKARSGRIINISSVVGITGNAGQANYAASKAGIIGFTKSVAKEYAAKGITCNAIAPGYIETEMTGAIPESLRQAMIDSIPLKRAGKPEDVAALAVFLAQDASSYITGEVIRTDGGMCI